MYEARPLLKLKNESSGVVYLYTKRRNKDFLKILIWNSVSHAEIDIIAFQWKYVVLRICGTFSYYKHFSGSTHIRWVHLEFQFHFCWPLVKNMCPLTIISIPWMVLELNTKISWTINNRALEIFNLHVRWHTKQTKDETNELTCVT